MEKKMKTRKVEENHIELKVSGPNREEIAKEIRAALREMKHRHTMSFEITVKDFPQ